MRNKGAGVLISARAAARGHTSPDTSGAEYAGRGVFPQQPQEISLVVTYNLLARKTEAEGVYINCPHPQSGVMKTDPTLGLS